MPEIDNHRMLSLRLIRLFSAYVMITEVNASNCTYSSRNTYQFLSNLIIVHQGIIGVHASHVRGQLPTLVQELSRGPLTLQYFAPRSKRDRYVGNCE